MFEKKELELKSAINYIRLFEKELGKDAIVEILKKDLKTKFHNTNKTINGDIEKEYKRIKDNIENDNFELELISKTNSLLQFNIKKCPFVELFEKLNARDIGHLLLCNYDFIGAKSRGFTLDRDKTLMQGNNCCNFKIIN